MQAPRESLKPNAVATNGNRSSNLTPLSPVGYRSLGRIFEILAVSWPLTGYFLVYWLNLGRLAAVVLIALLMTLSFFMYRWAIKYAVSARIAEKTLDQKQKARNDAITYQVTYTRLETLHEAGVPVDVRNALAKLISEQTPLSEQRFLEKIALDPVTNLGWERTLEFREKILKYTKLDRKSGVNPAAPQPY